MLEVSKIIHSPKNTKCKVRAILVHISSCRREVKILNSSKKITKCDVNYITNNIGLGTELRSVITANLSVMQ